MKIRAFTLAEVLITLGIIGIVAAMTLPAIVKKYEKLVTITKLKKIWTLLSNAHIAAENDFGPSEYWDYPHNSDITPIGFFKKYYEPYLKVKYITRKLYTVRNFNGEDTNFSQLMSPFGTETIGSVDGICLIPWSNNMYYTFNIDLNCSAPPNVVGKDVWSIAEFWWFGKKLAIPELQGILDSSDPAKTRREWLDYCKSHKFSGGGLIRCFAVVVYDGWKFEKDYPW